MHFDSDQTTEQKRRGYEVHYPVTWDGAVQASLIVSSQVYDQRIVLQTSLSIQLHKYSQCVPIHELQIGLRTDSPVLTPETGPLTVHLGYKPIKHTFRAFLQCGFSCPSRQRRLCHSVSVSTRDLSALKAPIPTPVLHRSCSY